MKNTPCHTGPDKTFGNRPPNRLVLSGAILTASFFWSHSAAALTVTTLGNGTLPSGDVVQTVQLELDPGDTVPWHYRTGPGWGTILSGTLTEDEGCGKPTSTYSAGSAFSEIPGRVHRVFNLGTDKLVLLWTEIVPSCHASEATVFVNGPTCLGNSGKSKLVKITPCNDDADGDTAGSSEEHGTKAEHSQDGAMKPAQTDAPQAKAAQVPAQTKAAGART